MSKEKVTYVNPCYYTRIKRAIQALEDAKNYIYSTDKLANDYVINRLKEQLEYNQKNHD